MRNSAIQWTDHTFNPWEGCTKVAPECKNCYAETLVDTRFHRSKWGKGQPRRRTSENLWKQPLTWNQQVICDFCGTAIYRKAIYFHPNGGAVCRTCNDVAVFHRPRVFCLSLGDWLDEEVPIEWLADLLALIHATPNLDWQLLTKRPQNWIERITGVFEFTGQDQEHFKRWNRGHVLCEGWLSEGDALLVPNNIWIGVSAGADQKAALEIPAKVHFLSCEPMLHALDTAYAKKFDQIIFGGESGKNAREFHVNWLRHGINVCRAHGVKVFVKQMGRNVVDRNDAGFDGDEGDWPMGTEFRELDSGYQGAPVRILLKDSHGGDMSEWPEDLRIREFPNNNPKLAAQ